MIEAGRAAPEGALVGVDVGGTFTDAAVVHAGRLVTAKLPTTPDDQSEAVGGRGAGGPRARRAWGPGTWPASATG